MDFTTHKSTVPTLFRTVLQNGLKLIQNGFALMLIKRFT